MDDQLASLRCDEDDEFQQVGGWVRADDEPPVKIFAEVIDEHGMFDRVKNVFVSDAVTAGRRVNLHTSILYYKKGFKSSRAR